MLSLNRRNWMLLAGAGILRSRLHAANPSFWNKKDPSDWTEDEIQLLLTKSPWAKEGATIPKPGAREASSAAAGVGPNGIGIGPGGRQEHQDTGPTNTPPPIQGVVIWESAQPILDARKKALPKEFQDHYTLSVSGVPWLGEVDRLIDQLRQFTTLQPNDQRPIQPGAVQKAAGRARAVLLGFSKDVLQLSANDKSIHFTTEVGDIILRAKFDTKEMLYRGHLAL